MRNRKKRIQLAKVLKNQNQITFIDVGSNIGLYSLIAAQKENISKIIAIEPNPVVIESLQENIAYSKSNKIEIQEGAVSHNKDVIELRYNDWHLGMGSITRGGSHSISVPSINRSVLSNKFHEIDNDIFIKVDVEGAECQVLEEIFSAQHIEKIKYVFVEVTPKWLNEDELERIYSIMHLNGFRETWRAKGEEQYDALFTKDKNYQIADHLKNEILKNKTSKPKYTICIPNYNMADTIDRAVTSVVEQLDDEYEILIIDDGSNDKSDKVIVELEKKFSSVRSILLKRDKNRQLGETRNYSIYAALGEYVLLHIDADDVWDPYLKDLVKLFHILEKLQS